jgi:hypothetical protein
MKFKSLKNAGEVSASGVGLGQLTAGGAGGAGCFQILAEGLRVLAGLDLLHVIQIGWIEELSPEQRARRAGPPRETNKECRSLA